jgi:hypothetical protein
MIKKLLRKLIRTEKGQALPMVLIMMAVGGLIIVPLLSYTSSGLKVGKAYEKMADEYYAADAGIEDGLWQIKYNNLHELFGNYERYNYDAEYNYPMSYPVNVNGLDVDITIENVWIPKDIAAPNNDEAEALIGAGKLIITGGVPAELTQQVKIYYYKEATDPPLYVNKIGIWLPPGISYDAEGECTLETWLTAKHKQYSRNVTPHQGGQAVVWTLATPLLFTELPGVIPSDTPMTSAFTFKFILDDPESERSPEAVAWITTSGVTDIPYTWDADVRVFHIHSVAGGADGTTIDAYSIKSELRELITGISGDYRAIGNTLMVDDNPWSNPPIRDRLLDYSDATVTDIPDNAQVDAAYLYWSGWLRAAGPEVIFEENCSNFDYPPMKWYTVSGTRWSISSGRFRGRGGNYTRDQKTLTMDSSIDLSAYVGQEVTISWNQTKSGSLSSSDALYYAFYNSTTGWSGDFEAFKGPATPTNPFSIPIPPEYLTNNFRMRFYFNFTSTSKYVYIDNIKITVQPKTEADTKVAFKINGDQVYFANDEHGNPNVPTKGPQEIIAGRSKMLENQTDEYSYACYRDVTGLVQTFAAQGNATYTVAHVYAETGDEWSYAAWSLIIIYSSPDTKENQLYLFGMSQGDFIYVDNNGTLEYPLSGFLVPDPIPGEVNAAKIACFVGEGDDYYEGDYIALNPPYFPNAPDSCKLWDGTLSTAHPGSNTQSHPNNVWNSKSLGLVEDGIDIDTFYVSWASGLLEPEDSSALVALQTGSDSWNLIYIIISFRSRTVTGGTITYLIEG